MKVPTMIKIYFLDVHEQIISYLYITTYLFKAKNNNRF